MRALRWRLTMLPLNSKITRREAYQGVTITYLANFALPRLGELARCGVIAGTGKASFEAVFGTVVLERTWDLISYILILIVVLLGGNSAFGEFITKEVWSSAVQKFQVNIIWILASVFIVLIVGLILIYKYRNNLRKYKFFAKMLEIAKGLVNGFTLGLKMKHKWNFFGYTILLWFCYWMMSYFTILAFPQVSSDLNWLDAMFLMLVGGLGWFVPVQGGIGAYHFILSLAMASIYSIPKASGVVFATVSHESQMITMLICGTLSIISLYLHKRKIKIKQI